MALLIDTLDVDDSLGVELVLEHERSLRREVNAREIEDGLTEALTLGTKQTEQVEAARVLVALKQTSSDSHVQLEFVVAHLELIRNVVVTSWVLRDDHERIRALAELSLDRLAALVVLHLNVLVIVVGLVGVLIFDEHLERVEVRIEEQFKVHLTCDALGNGELVSEDDIADARSHHLQIGSRKRVDLFDGTVVRMALVRNLVLMVTRMDLIQSVDNVLCAFFLHSIQPAGATHFIVLNFDRLLGLFNGNHGDEQVNMRAVKEAAHLDDGVLVLENKRVFITLVNLCCKNFSITFLL